MWGKPSPSREKHSIRTLGAFRALGIVAGIPLLPSRERDRNASDAAIQYFAFHHPDEMEVFLTHTK